VRRTARVAARIGGPRARTPAPQRGRNGAKVPADSVMKLRPSQSRLKVDHQFVRYGRAVKMVHDAESKTGGSTETLICGVAYYMI